MNRKQRRTAAKLGKQTPAPAGAAAAGDRSVQIARLFDVALQHHRSGRLAQAEDGYKEALAIEPNHVDSLHFLGVVALQSGRNDLAIDLIGKAIVLNDRVAAFHDHIGLALRALGQLGDAVAHFTRAAKLDPNFAAAYGNLGEVLREQGKFDDAVCQFRQALALKPDYAEARHGLGIALHRQGKLQEAVAEYERAVTLKPDYADAHNSLGLAFQEQGKFSEAVAQFRQALALQPSLAEVHYNLGNALMKQWKLAEAVICYERALALRPDFVEAYCNLGNTLKEQGKLDAAVDRYRQALATNPRYADAYNNLGSALRDLGRLEEAHRAYEKAIELAPNRPLFYLSYATSKRFTPGDVHLATMEKLASDSSLAETDRMYLHFALGKAYGDLRDHEESFRHLIEGNALKRQRTVYDEAESRDLLGRIPAVFTPELMRDKQNLGDPSPVPVFIVGMPRSGTTLIEQILASHPKVFGAGELALLDAAVGTLRRPDGGVVPFPEVVLSMGGEQLRELGTSYVAAIRDLAPKAERITDKAPLNFRFAGLIHLALPHARIIHVRRDPIDTCLSCFSKLFAGDQPYSYDLAELGRFYRYYEALMEHWRRVLPPGVMLEVQYEDITNDLEGQARRLVAHCGLEWDDACLSFHLTQRPVQTLSAAEVRQPIYRTSVGRSRPYQRVLGPLLEALSSESTSVMRTAAKPNLEMRMLPGPSVFVPFAAVVAEFTIPAAIAPPRGGTLPEVICARLPGAVITRIQTLDWGASFETLVAGLAQALQDWHGPNNLPCQTSRTSSGRGLVYLGYYDEQATAQALQLGYELALLAYAQGQQPLDANSALIARVTQLGAVMQARQPGELERAMIGAARARDIPFYRVVPGQKVLQYGQGKYGRHFLGTGSQCDSNTGALLQHNKVVSNHLVRRLGFPGVEHAVAETVDNAVRLASRIGYPLVIKPVDGRQGQGVTAGVTSEEEVAAAFAEANAISPGRVIVERFIEGENVRLCVFFGRFDYATSRSPPRLVGDGKHTVMELIDLENQRRPRQRRKHSQEAQS